MPVLCGRSKGSLRGTPGPHRLSGALLAAHGIYANALGFRVLCHEARGGGLLARVQDA